MRQTKMTFKHTMYGCYVGYIVQAIVNNYIPLLFLTFQSGYGIPLTKITLLITFNFVIQLLVDLLSASFIDRIGYRGSMLLAHVFSAAGLIGLTIFPELFANPFYGLLMAVMIYAIGGGLLEVLVSPIMEACPTDNKEQAMSLLHSFYCWGHVGVVLISTMFFHFAGITNWKIMAILWALIPIANFFVFLRTPIAPLIEEGQESMSLRHLFSNKIFWLLMLMMVCSGASEQAVSQWASTFAEKGLGVSKAIGDLTGPMAFAILMGVARAFYGVYGHKIDLDKFMIGSAALCVVSYLMISLSPYPVVSLIGCAICGLSVGIMWPGSFSKAAASLRSGGTLMFALLALAGDLGCSGGPTLVGMVAGYFGDRLQTGILAGIIFPVMMILCILFFIGHKSKN
ncbi:MAG: MFS transporter [Lachnospiraceae bacterium]